MLDVYAICLYGNQGSKDYLSIIMFEKLESKFPSLEGAINIDVLYLNIGAEAC